MKSLTIIFSFIFSLKMVAKVPKPSNIIDCSQIKDNHTALTSYFIYEEFVPRIATNRKLPIKSLYRDLFDFNKNYLRGEKDLELACANKSSFECKVLRYRINFNKYVAIACSKFKKMAKYVNYQDPDFPPYEFVKLDHIRRYFSPKMKLSLNDWVTMRKNPAFETLSKKSERATSQQEESAKPFCFKYMEAVIISKLRYFLDAKGLSSIHHLLGRINSHIDNDTKFSSFKDEFDDVLSEYQMTNKMMKDELKASIKPLVNYCSRIRFESSEVVLKKACQLNSKSLICLNYSK